jgi:hypothetical protein
MFMKNQSSFNYQFLSHLIKIADIYFVLSQFKTQPNCGSVI